MKPTHYSPLRYPGGKNCIFPFMAKFFYENNLLGISYAEPYAGGAGLAIHLLIEGYVQRIYINDLDPNIYLFWKVVLNRTDDFCNWIESVPVTLETWRYYKEQYKKGIEEDEFEIAKCTFYLNRTNISGVLDAGPIGGYSQTAKFKIDARFNKEDLIRKIRIIASRKRDIVLSNYDGIEFIKSLNRKRSNIFIYLDPPYVEKGHFLYMNCFKKADHIELAKFVSKIKKPWMVSYDLNDLILKCYSRWNMIQYQLLQCTSNCKKSEILVFSNGLEFSNSMKELTQPQLLNTPRMSYSCPTEKY